jgi:hypothetical protein
MHEPWARDRGRRLLLRVQLARFRLLRIGATYDNMN